MTRETKFLGISLDSWLKLIVAPLIGATVFLFTWYNTVNADIRSLKSRPTFQQVSEILTEELEEHSKTVHGRLDERLNQLEEDVRLTRDSQMRQEGFQKATNAALERVMAELERQR